MEGIGSEVSQKIRAAIKAKLIELGAYVDDELPDYIMVMVANKRTRSQMDEDLQLFLSSNTKIFTSWLHTVLQKLQEVTVASFENKKNPDGKKSKRKKDYDEKSKKSSDDDVEKSKKHNKKHKDGKKSKKNKHKSKEKLRSDKKSDQNDETKTSQEKSSKGKKMHLNEAVGKAILGDLKKNKKLKDGKYKSSSASDDSSVLNANEEKKNENENCKVDGTYADDDVLNIKLDDEPEGRNLDKNQQNTKEVIEDEFNIEPLKPTEKVDETESTKDIKTTARDVASEPNQSETAQVETTISAPTEELLKEHNKLQNERLEGEELKEKKKAQSDSDDSISPEEMRKQLLLSRAKKKLEESKLAKRMKSNSPDVLILEDANRGTRENESFCMSRSGLSKPEIGEGRSRSRDSFQTGSLNRLSRKPSPSDSSDRRSQSPDVSPFRKGGGTSDYKSKSATTTTYNDRNKRVEGDERKKGGVIKISESLELEKNLGVKKSKDKEVSSKRRPLSSRVVTISDPEAPEIPSIVKVKPREFISKDKQANKALILKAVADAEKSIATIHVRNETEPEPAKTALFTKNLRGKRYEKLAVTLSNIRRSPDGLERRVSVDSEKSGRSRPKHDSSDVSDYARGRSDLPSKKLSKSDDQFISSKTTIMEKNEKYIRCWLEGVEKAVKDDEIVNPNEMEDLADANLTDEEQEFINSEVLKKEDEKKRKRTNTDEVSGNSAAKNQKLSEKEIANLRLIPNSTTPVEGPQIVVTLDGLKSKTIKDLISKNKDCSHKPISYSGKEKSPTERKSSFEKISDRFGRLNKVNELDAKKKSSKYQSTDKEKKKTEVVSTESKNRQLIAQLSEKFGKVDREFENKKRRRIDEDRRYDSRRSDVEEERNGKYRKTDRRSIREGISSLTSSKHILSQTCKYYPNCSKNDCRYYHPKKCLLDLDCTNSDCKYTHTSNKKKSKWYSKS